MSEDTNSQHHLRAELKHLADTLEEVLNSSAEKSKSELHKIRSKAHDVLASTRSHMSDSGERLIQTSREMADRTDDYVRENPWTSVGIGAAIGVVLGIMITSRR